MNDPYPTNAQLEAEAEADTMLAEQVAGTAAFAIIVRHAVAEILKLHLPLGSPAAGYDLDDITGAMLDWLTPRDERSLEREADEIVRERWAA